MVVLLPLQEGESVRICEACSHVGLASPVVERTSFRPKYRGRFRSRCRTCDERAENQTIDAWEEREARGERLPSYGEVRQRVTRCWTMRPVGPWQEFVEELIRLKAKDGAAERVEGDVADALGMTIRRLYAWRSADPEEEVDEGVVDRYLTYYSGETYGGITVDEIYERFGEGRGETVATKPKAKPPAKPPARTCRSGSGCPRPPAAGGRFCREHADQLALVRDQMIDQTKTFKKRIKRQGARPTCCRPGCDEPRLASEAYCFTCQDAGWVESDE